MALDTLQWHDYYITIQRGGTGTHQVAVYLDGNLTPAAEWDVTASPSTFNNAITYVALAMGSTPQSGSIEIDFLEVAPGVAPPRLACPSEGDTHCPVDGLAVTQVDGVPGEAGTYRAEVTGATDNSDDPILYTFTIVSDGRDAKVIGPQPANAVEFRLETGTHVVTATVDDSSICPDETVDATCGPVDLTVVVVEPEGPLFKRGDCNGDGEVNISDATCALEWLFAEAPAPGCLAALNTNGDDDVNIADPVSLLNFLFSDGTPPVTPFPDCGPGTLPADERLGCTNPPACQ